MARIDIAPTVQAGFSVKAIKNWQSREGGGYQFKLYFGGKNVAFVHQDGNGGPTDVRWEGLRWDGSIMDPAALNITGRKATTYRKNAEKAQVAKAKFDELVAATPTVDTEWGGDPLTVGEGWLMEELLAFTELAKACKRKTCFRQTTDGDLNYTMINEAYGPTMKAYVEKNYPGSVILNEEVNAMLATAA